MTEAYVLKYLVPMTINSKMVLLHKKLNLIIDEVVNSSSHHHFHRHHAFSSTDYFFVSTNIARRFMDVPESAIVLAYSDQHPIIKQIDATVNNDDNNDRMDSNEGSSIYHYIVVVIGALSSLLLKALTIVLLGMGQLPEIVQV